MKEEIRIYISCDPADRAIGQILEEWLIKVFPSAEVFIADHQCAGCCGTHGRKHMWRPPRRRFG